MDSRVSPELLVHVVERLAALADPTRIRLLLRLREGSANVNRLAGDLEINQASASKHLNVLRRAGLIVARREGTQAIYSVHDASIFDMCRLVCDGVKRHLHEQHASIGQLTGSGGRPRARSSSRGRGGNGRGAKKAS